MPRSLICLAIFGSVLALAGCGGGSSADDGGRVVGGVIRGGDDVPTPTFKTTPEPPPPPRPPKPTPAQVDREVFIDEEEWGNITCFLYTKAANGELALDFDQLRGQVFE